ncbi:ROK family transcriptional regulator [Clostridium estertheticum]|uniref:ROK family transcriptional regulator n=1 Tax=Clostridium estertheticum TaxID=238834 RepID=UPI0013E93A38|nr:ROK family transcriptional regulator [Clostridium estertheticum]MBZ9686905.1 ROK family transcriptional regulator [Clostridium estertheticum]
MKILVKHDQEYMKKLNKTMVLKIIRNKGPISRASIARLTSMSPTSISRIVSELSNIGLVYETEPYSEGVGRKATLLSIYPDSIATIGVYLNRDIIRLGIVNFVGKIIFQKEFQYDASKHSAYEVADKLAYIIINSIVELKINTPKIIGVGIGMPGIVDTKNGKIILSAQLGWKNIDFVELINKRINMKTCIDNTVKLKALAESIYGVAKSSPKLAMISIGSGVGSALVMDGHVLRGESNIAGEVGHTIVDPDGMLCECGRRGCLQTYIAESALLTEANKVHKINNIGEIFECATNGENWAISILERAAMYIAILINNVACMYSPDTIILSGRLIEQYPMMIELVEKRRSLIWEPFKGTFNLVYSQLKKESVIIGAATLALNEFLNLE